MDNERLDILKILIENQQDKFSIRKLSKLRKINYKTAYESMYSLKKENIINMIKLGNTFNCSFSRKLNTSVFAVEYERRKELLKNKNFYVIYNRFNELNFPLIVLLFGSSIRNHDKNSDIDLLIITDNQKAAEQTVSLIPLNIHPTIISYKEFTIMAKSREFSVVSEAIKKNIILINIEEYYRLLENVGQK